MRKTLTDNRLLLVAIGVCLMLAALILFAPKRGKSQLVTFVPNCAGTDDTVAFTNIINAVGSNVAAIGLPGNKSSISRCAVSNLTIPSNITLDNDNGSGVKVITGQTLTVLGPVANPPTKQLFYNLGTGLGSVSFTGNAQVGAFPVPWFAQGGLGTQGSPYTGVETAVPWAASTTYLFGGHYYTWSTAPNWNLENIKIYGDSATILYTGTGVGMQFNNSSGYNNEILAQDFHVIGNASATDGVLFSGIARSVFRNIQVSKFPQKAFHFKFFIANTVDNLTLSINSDGVTTTPHPQYGYYLEYRTSSSEGTQGNNFQNVVIEGATIAAIYMDTAKANNFYIQTVEANAAGVVLRNTSNYNNFYGGDYEANGFIFTPPTSVDGLDFDIVNSTNTSLWNIFSVGTVAIGAGASSTFISGALGPVTIAASATGTHFGQFTATSVTDLSGVGNTIYYASGGGNSYTIGRQKFTSVDATTLRTQPTVAGALSIINTPSGNNGSVFSLDSTDRVADGANIAGLGVAANIGAAVRFYSLGVGSATRQNIEICADQATPNSSSCGNQLRLPTTGGVQIGNGTTLLKVLSGTASLDFGATAAGTCDSLTINVAGAVDGDTVSLGIPNALATADTYQSFQGFVSSAGVVTVKRCNLTNATTALSNPSAATVRATVLQF